MKKNRTDLIFLIDRSGSMSNISSDMIGGYNEFIKKQKELPNECFVSFYQFDDKYETVFERVNLKNVMDLTNKTYSPRGNTALYDAIGKTINSYGKYLSDLEENKRPERILFVVMTDGMNNSSSEFTDVKVKEMVKHQTDIYKWDFVFLCSNIDAWESGNSLGISNKTTLQFANSPDSVKHAFMSLSANALSYRSVDVHNSYTFSSSDVDSQTQFLDNNLKSKNKKQTNKKTTT